MCRTCRILQQVIFSQGISDQNISRMTIVGQLIDLAISPQIGRLHGIKKKCNYKIKKFLLQTS